MLSAYLPRRAAPRLLMRHERDSGDGAYSIRLHGASYASPDAPRLICRAGCSGRHSAQRRAIAGYFAARCTCDAHYCRRPDEDIAASMSIR